MNISKNKTLIIGSLIMIVAGVYFVASFLIEDHHNWTYSLSNGMAVFYGQLGIATSMMAPFLKRWRRVIERKIGMVGFTFAAIYHSQVFAIEPSMPILLLSGSIAFILLGGWVLGRLFQKVIPGIKFELATNVADPSKN